MHSIKLHGFHVDPDAKWMKVTWTILGEGNSGLPEMSWSCHMICKRAAFLSSLLPSCVDASYACIVARQPSMIPTNVGHCLGLLVIFGCRSSGSGCDFSVLHLFLMGILKYPSLSVWDFCFVCKFFIVQFIYHEPPKPWKIMVLATYTPKKNWKCRFGGLMVHVYIYIWISQNLQSWADDRGSHLAVVESSAQALLILP